MFAMTTQVIFQGFPNLNANQVEDAKIAALAFATV